MKETIEARELILLDSLDVVIQGTYHKTYRKTYDDSSDTQSMLTDRGRVGVVFLNGLSATRAANGDAAVYWADSFAECGYPSFRIDLPGFGDSEGDPPTEWLSFTNMGGYASIASAKIKELVARFDLSGVVIMGHCAGAVSAIYTAAASTECRGLVLMDPYFHLPQTIRPKVRQQLNVWALQSRLGGLLSNLYDRLKEFRLLLRANTPPENANFALLRSWKEVASRGLPILIFKAPGWKAAGTKPRVGEFDYFKYVLGLAGRRSKVDVKVADGANHSFANHLGRAIVRQHTEQWLDACFPLTKCNDSLADTARPVPCNREIYYENRERCLKV